jgi:ribosomal protein L40E
MQSKIYTPIVRAVVIMIFLAILSSILQRLPMLQDLIVPEIGVTAARLAKSIISLIMIVVLWNFVREFSPALQEILPKMPESTIFLRHVVFLISVVVIYGALLSVIRGLIYEYIWIYQLSFVLLALFPIVLGGMLLYGSIDKIVGSVSEKATKMMEMPCPHCGTSNPQSGKFCQKCGKELIVQSTPVSSKKCANCGTENNTSADYCSKCGTKLS